MLQAITFSLSLMGVIAWLYGSSWGGVIGFVAAVWFVSDLRAQHQMHKFIMSRLERDAEGPVDPGLNRKRK